MKKKMNKRADIPVTLLVIGVFAICTLAIISFKIASVNSTKGFSESMQAMEDMNAEIQKYDFYQKQGITDNSEIEKLLNTGGKNYLEVEGRVKETNKQGELIIDVKFPLN